MPVVCPVAAAKGHPTPLDLGLLKSKTWRIDSARSLKNKDLYVKYLKINDLLSNCLFQIANNKFV